jgi:hypothetical protein
MPTTTSPLTPTTHGLRVAASFNPFSGRLLTPMRHDRRERRKEPTLLRKWAVQARLSRCLFPALTPRPRLEKPAATASAMIVHLPESSKRYFLSIYCRNPRLGEGGVGQIYDSPTSMPIPSRVAPGPEVGGIMRSMSFTVELPLSRKRYVSVPPGAEAEVRFKPS